jgi:hypothetical protein
MYSIYGILQNTKTNRYHPILFRRAPMPGGADAELTHQRYRSAGHHTIGFDTLPEAQANIVQMCATHGLMDSGCLYPWDGEDVPAMVEFFSESAIVTRDSIVMGNAGTDTLSMTGEIILGNAGTDALSGQVSLESGSSHDPC